MFIEKVGDKLRQNIIKKVSFIESVYNEIFCEKLAKSLGINCAHYEFVKTRKNGNILISKNILKENEKLIEACSFINDQVNCLNVLLKNLEKAQQYMGYKFNMQEIELDLFKIIVFDYLTSQADRHDKNYGFIASEKNRETYLKVAPIFDNEHSFGLTNNGMTTDNNDNYDVKKALNMPMCFGIYDGCNHESMNSSGTEKFVYAREIVDYAFKKPYLKDFLKMCFKNSTLTECIKEIKKVKPKINEKLVNHYSNCLTQKMLTLLQTYEHVSTLNTKQKPLNSIYEM